MENHLLKPRHLFHCPAPLFEKRKIVLLSSMTVPQLSRPETHRFLDGFGTAELLLVILKGIDLTDAA